MSDDIEDIVAMARAAQRDERLADGPLYGKLADEITRLRARVEKLERQHPVVATAGCQCPPGADIHCANSWCPRKSLSFRVTSTSK